MDNYKYEISFNALLASCSDEIIYLIPQAAIPTAVPAIAIVRIIFMTFCVSAPNPLAKAGDALLTTRTQLNADNK